MNIQQGVAELIAGRNLSETDMQSVMREIMTGQSSDAQIGGFLVALAIKGETNEEVIGAAKVMRELANKVVIENTALTDIVGTGGDSGPKIFNVSTASSFVVAAAGATVAKHGNRSITSKSGAADLLECAGVRLDLSADEVGRCISEVGVGFMFSVNHHSAMRHAIGPRKELAVRTVFNLLGPLTNPASAAHGLVGVFSADWLPTFAEVFKAVGAKHMLCVHSNDGLDELSIASGNQVYELKDGQIKQYSLTPEQFGLPRGNLDELKVDNAEQSLALIKAAYTGENETASNMLALNAGAAIYAADLCNTIEQGISMAQDAMSAGLAQQKMNELVEFTQLLKASA
ncbi:MAG: anthranilate phosphoribosyltransferase [Pseudomonadales bacterium]